MLTSKVDTAYLTNLEPVLKDYLRTDEGASFSATAYINDAFTQLISDIIDRGKEIRLLCPKLVLDTVTKTAAYTGVKSARDYAQRFRLIVDASDVQGAAAFTLQGTNDDSSETYTDIATLSINNGVTGISTTTFSTPYKYYRLNLNSIGTSITYKSYLIESHYELPHAYYSLYLCFNRLRSNDGDTFDIKSREYLQRYYQKIDSMRMYYDSDDSDSISEGEYDTSETISWGR